MRWVGFVTQSRVIRLSARHGVATISIHGAAGEVVIMEIYCQPMGDLLWLRGFFSCEPSKELVPTLGTSGSRF